MRPRISTSEADYILQLLEQNEQALQGKKQHLFSLNCEVNRLKQELRTDTYHAVIIGKYPEKQAELARLEKEKYQLEQHLEAHVKLTEKYKAIAAGSPRRGTIKHLNHITHFPTTKIMQVIHA